MKETIPTLLVPEAVVESLNASELQELIEAIGTLSEPYPTLFSFPTRTTNRGLIYLGLNDPFKYSILSLPTILDEELVGLLSHDASRLDAYHEMMWSHDKVQGLWEQRFSSTMAALGNPNISTETAASAIQLLIETEPTGITAYEVVDTVGSQLLDKWDPVTFSKAALNELVRLFEIHGAAEYLPQFKRWARRAS